jgi:hypothetical protein
VLHRARLGVSWYITRVSLVVVSSYYSRPAGQPEDILLASSPKAMVMYQAAPHPIQVL